MKRVVVWTVLAALCAASSVAGTDDFAYLHSKFKRGQPKLGRMVVLPAVVRTIWASPLTGETGVSKEAERLEQSLTDAIVHALHSRDAAVTSLRRGDGTSERDREIEDLERSFDVIADKIERSPRDVRNGRYSMGDAAAWCCDAVDNADTLVFVRALATVNFTERRKKPPKINGVVNAFRLSVVDAHSGVVLYWADLGFCGACFDDAEKMKEQMRRAIGLGEDRALYFFVH